MTRSCMARWALAAALVISGCGGGGGGSNNNPPPTAPAVTAVTPTNGSTGVAITTSVTATFSEAMNAPTLTASTFTLAAQGVSAVAGAVTYSAGANKATFTPAASLAYGTTYTATITTGAASTGGTAMAANYMWSFTTASAPAPTVASVMPTDGSTGIAATTTVSATFGEAMNASTLTTSTFTLTPQGGAAVAGSVSYSAGTDTATFTPAASLGYGTTYTATITTGAQSAAGTALATNYSWTFSTAFAAPTVTAVSPANNSSGVAVNPTITATFNQAMDGSTINSSSFMLSAQGGSAVTGTVSYSAATMTASFAPTTNLGYNTTYAATLTTGVTTSEGVPLAANYVWMFTTMQEPAPTIAVTVPIDGATNVSVDQAVSATFDEAMDPATINSLTFTVEDGSGNAGTGTVTYSSANPTATFTLASPLDYNTKYTATLTTGMKNTGGTSLASNYQWSFTTAPVPNTAAIDFGTTYQTIRGFGGSTAWMGTLPGAGINALFGTGNGQIGLSILRVRIDPSGSSTSGWITANWAQELANAQEATAANPNAIAIATPWTPPPSMKSNSSTVQGTLNTSSYGAYASYLEDFVNYFVNHNAPLYAISMQNEPDAIVTYESCLWTGTTMDSWVASLTAGGAVNPLTTRLMMPESESFNPTYSDPSLNDANAVGNISIIAGHLYGTAPSYYANAENKGKEVWQTEHYLTPAGGQPTISDALKAAKEIHDSLTVGQYNAYLWWWVVDWNPGMGVTNYGLIDTSYNLNYYGYAMAQFAHFIQPGYVRVSATANPVNGVYVSAYTNSGNTHYVIVVINMGASAVSQLFTIQNGSITSLTPYETTSGGGMMQQPAVSVTGGQFTFTLPAQSIVTFVQ